MENHERIDILFDAQVQINKGIRRIRRAVKGTNVEAYCESYIIGHLDNWTNGENSFDTTIPKLIQKLEEGEID